MNMPGVSSFKNLQPSQLINKLIQYLETELPNFTISEEFLRTPFNKRNEDQYTYDLCSFLIGRSNSSFSFIPQARQKASYKVDIGVHFRGGVLIFTIEAKVLPNPKRNKGKDHQYVYGNGAGIQRYKDENHGIDLEDRLLSQNGMIGYVENHDFNHWYSTINQWVSDASWLEEEKLEIVSFDKIARLKSKHSRKGGSQVTLHHFWVQVI